jgi:hypothetical protein
MPTPHSQHRTLWHCNPVVILEYRYALIHELALGGECFKQRIEEMAKRRTRLVQTGRPRRL